MKKGLVFALLFCTLVTSLPTFASASPHSVGTNIKTPEGTVYLISSEGTRRPYTSAGAFLSYGFNSWSNVVPATQEDLNLPIGAYVPPQDGKIICSEKGTDKGTCYLISQSKKVGFPSEDVFTKQGYSFSKALYGDVSFIVSDTPLTLTDGYSAHKKGTLINKDGTIYLVTGTRTVAGIPNLEIFNSWGFKFEDVIPANNSDLPLSVISNLELRGAGQLTPYFTSIYTPNTSNNIAKVMGTNPNNNVRNTISGQQDAPIFSFRVDASSQKDLLVQGFEFEIKSFPDGQSVDGQVTLTSVKDITNPSIATNISSSLSGKRAQTTFNGNYITIPAGQSKEFVVYANMSSNLSSGYLGITLKRVMNFYNSPVENDDFINGVIYVTSTTATNIYYPTAKVSTYSPKTTIYPGTQQEIFSFVIKAPDSGTITIQQLSFEFNGTILPSYLSNLKLIHWEDNAQVGSNSGNTMNYNSIGMAVSPGVTISNGSSAEFILKADISASAGGQTIQPKLTQVWTVTPNTNLALATVTGVPLQNNLLTIQYLPTQYIKNFTVTSPVDKETIYSGNTKYITWTWTGTSTLSNLSITLMRKNEYGGYTQQEVISSSVPNTGSYAWYVSSSLPSGKYYVLVKDTYNSDIFDDSNGDFTINNPAIPENSTTSASAQRDNIRLSAIRQLASALELYFNDYNSYPIVIGSLAPIYTSTVPTAPTPADGTCTTNQNTYVYTSQSATSYSLSFCLGATTQGYSAGYHTLTQQGIN